VDVVDRNVTTVTPGTSLETVMSVFATSPVVIVVASEAEPKRAISILTKIDLLSYLTAPAHR
jgi:predicted transcriptional regulator